VALPIDPTPVRETATVAPGSAVPEITKVVSEVVRSDDDVPLSLDTAVTDGADGAVVSTVIVSPEDAALVPPPVVAVAVIVWFPPERVDAVTLQLPLPSTVPVPTVPLTLLIRVIVLPACPVPSNVGVLSDVRLSVDEVPVSLDALRSGVDGVLGGASPPSNDTS